jgi:hypothetical protein
MTDPEAGMPTHAAIFAKLSVLEARFDDHARMEETARVERRADRREIAARMSGTEAAVLRIEAALKPLVEGQAEHDQRIDELESGEDQRTGREGIIAAILRSPLAQWLAIVSGWIAAAAAWMKGDLQ